VRAEYLAMMATRDQLLLLVGLIVIVYIVILGAIHNERTRDFVAWAYVGFYLISFAVMYYGFSIYTQAGNPGP
jgi:hypothetical protein